MRFAEFIKPSIGFKLGFLLATFGILATGLTGYYFYSSSLNMLARAAERDLLTATQVVGRDMEITIDSIAQDAQLLAAIPLASKIFNSSNEASAEPDKKLLADTFTAMLLAHPEYFQIRLISANQHGLELVRVDRNGKELTRVLAENLQEKEHYPYVFNTLQLAQGEFYLSDITIHHEKGAHSGLNKPTVTVSTPVISSGGKRLGLIVINIDLDGLSNLLQGNLPNTYQLYLSNQWGDFLIHPDATQTFGFDRGKSILIQDSFPSVLSLLHGQGTTVVTDVDAQSQKQDENVAAFVRLPFGDTVEKRFVILGLSQPLSSVMRETSKLSWETIQIILAFSGLALVLSALVTRIVTSPLNAIVTAIKHFSKNHEISMLPLTRTDELGLLARSFHDMQTEIMVHLSELNESHKALDHLARHDTLTGLPNRRMFFDRLEHAIANSRRSGKQLAVLFIDLDRFKEINDTLGHSVGDAVLETVAHLLRSAVREVDTVARIGGDEFIVLLDTIDDPQHVEMIVQKLHDLFQSPFQIEGYELNVKASMGGCIFPRDGNDADELMQNADQAMYNSKKEGRNTFSFYVAGSEAPKTMMMQGVIVGDE